MHGLLGYLLQLTHGLIRAGSMRHYMHLTSWFEGTYRKSITFPESIDSRGCREGGRQVQGLSCRLIYMYRTRSRLISVLDGNRKRGIHGCILPTLDIDINSTFAMPVHIFCFNAQTSKRHSMHAWCCAVTEKCNSVFGQRMHSALNMCLSHIWRKDLNALSFCFLSSCHTYACN